MSDQEIQLHQFIGRYTFEYVSDSMNSELNKQRCMIIALKLMLVREMLNEDGDYNNELYSSFCSMEKTQQFKKDFNLLSDHNRHEFVTILENTFNELQKKLLEI